jgi:putative peptidoglycan lipid II flippase
VEDLLEEDTGDPAFMTPGPLNEASVLQVQPHKPVLGLTAVVTALLVAGQVSTALTYSAMAAVFGRGSEMDSYLIGTTMPQYVVAVMVSALTFGLVPILTEHASRGPAGGQQLAGQLLAVVMGGLSLTAIAGALTSGLFIGWIAPSLPTYSHDLAVRVSWVAWPAVVAAGLVTTLSAIDNVHRRFAWAAAIPAVGGIVTLGLVLVLARRFGALGLAAASTAGTLCQVALFGPTWLKRCRFPDNLRHPGLITAFHLLWPLMLSGFFLRATPIVDRYLVSDLGQGSIAALAYAGNLSRFLALAVSAGLATIVFPQLATTLIAADHASFRRLVTGSLRLTWFVAAPVACIGWALARPIIQAAFERGSFSSADTSIVAALFRIYLGAFIALCLGNISGRAIYALRKTRVFALLATAETFLYFGYNAGLVRWWGVAGAAVAYFVYCAVSLAWQMGLISSACGGSRVLTFAPYGRTLVAAVVSGMSAALTGRMLPNPWLALAAGGAVGVVVYSWLISRLRSAEGRLIHSQVRRRLGRRLGGAKTL